MPHFCDIDALTCTSKYLDSPPQPCFMPPSGGTTCHINVIYRSLKSTFNGLQFRR